MAEHEPTFVTYKPHLNVSDEEMVKRSEAFLELMSTRHTIREFSSQPVSETLILNCIKTALTSPSSANTQPWHFVLVKDQEMKRQIREQAEVEEQADFQKYIPQSKLEAFSPIATSGRKTFLEQAPYIIAVFEEKVAQDDLGKQAEISFSKESVFISVGLLIAAIHNAGLVVFPHTPTPLTFLNKLLDQPEKMEPVLLLLVGHASPKAKILQAMKKPFNEVITIR